MAAPEEPIAYHLLCPALRCFFLAHSLAPGCSPPCLLPVQVVETVAQHFADLVPATSFKPGSLGRMDSTLRVNEDRIARATCVYRGAVITAIILPVYGEFTLPNRCNSTQSYQ